MAVRHEEEKERGSAPPIALGYLQKAWEWQWALRLTYLLLYADLALLLSDRHGLLHAAIKGDWLPQSIVFLCLTITAFGLIASMVIPALADFVRSIVIEIAYGIPSRWTAIFHHEPRWSRPIGCVTPHEIHNLALEEKDEFLLRLYERYDRGESLSREQRKQAGGLIFGVVLLTVADGAVFVGGIEDESIVHALLNACFPWGILFGIAMAFAGLWALKWAWLESYQPNWIYYPPLYRVIQAAEDKRR
ncbi:hypothetical protein G3O06_20755 [Burkholderia sp. Ac-20345]|uniref:hypothetical protein n=1 Tax=Burkholderia sp. Ac-20345 TaxID=2703891 RepID=UPI00197B50BA|nr:hypothetical protein [Burkholderia sp. Ac-20345]MBN3779970.1 hypothetical protein [Burkholderia sp. Ac-20345]